MNIILKWSVILCALLYAPLLFAKTITYTVKKHDTLWGISANEYHNPLRWPYIYHSNLDKIKDPDLIYPSQIFNIFNDHNENRQKLTNAWYITFSTGATLFAKPDNYMTPARYPFTGTDSYLYQGNKINAALSISGGYEWRHNTNFWLPSYSLGLRYSYYFPNKVEGNYKLTIEQPTHFTYRTKSQTLFAFGKVSLLRWHNVTPYIIGGVGMARNIFLDYQDSFDVVWLDNEHLFPNKTSVNFAYLVGLGADYKITKNWRLGLEYHYADLGNFRSKANKKGTTIPISLQE